MKAHHHWALAALSVAVTHTPINEGGVYMKSRLLGAFSVRKKSLLIFTTLSALLCCGSASAYYVAISGQALSLHDTNVISYGDLLNDGPTSIAYDTGLVYGSDPLFGYAQSSAYADLTTGTLGLYAMSTAGQVAGGDASLSDILHFTLPTGMTSTLVTASFTIDGSVTGSLNPGTLPLFLSFACITSGPTCSGSGEDSVSLHNFTSPTTLSVSVTVSDGANVQITAALTGSTGQGQSGSGISLIDLSNTGRLSISLEPGVVFSSESGVFLTSVPIPAAFWLFGSGLLGLITLARKRGRLG